MPNTYKKIASVVVGSGGTSAINFTSIPQTFTDLKIVLSARHTASETSNDVLVTINSSTSNFTARRLYGNGSSAASDTNARVVGMTVGASATASVFGNSEVYFPNYTSSNYKSYSADLVGENNASTAYQVLIAGLWSNTAAITSISLAPGSGSFVQYSTATLYGIGDVTASKFAKATGGLITYDSTYVYHTFTSSGIFTPNTALTADYLVVAGGGGGNGGFGGGGGAGGLRSTVDATGGSGSLETPLSLSSGSAYTVTVGAGGNGANGGSGGTPTQGSSSVFATITSAGGGFGGHSTIGGAGGSSGGVANNNGSPQAASAGFQGGTSSTSIVHGGGGGGAGAVGANGTGSSSSNVAGAGGNGGAGRSISISGISTTYAGGGGGGTYNNGNKTAGTGGSGGGGNGSNTGAGSAGTTNTGGGGGGGTYNQPAATHYSGGNGGSGIVIVRYTR
jgi:hypothetical protein